ncbi:hypothetical protein MKEN_00900500 [Mycena kentingensis (nom. inval.)]|nr:hypothetical protein MKEN_00900500 [Mycena kentingensis (nom. inval.)]
MSLRQRIPFRAADDDDGRHVLDETEQEELIETLRNQNSQSSHQAIILLDVVLACATLLQVVFLLKDPKQSPLFALFPPSSWDAMPAPVLLTILAFLLHANLVLHVHPTLIPASMPLPLSYATSYALALVAPTLSIFLGRVWQTTAWTFAPAAVVGLVHSVHSTLREGDAALAELETLKYNAPGA